MCPKIKVNDDWYYDTESEYYEHMCRCGKSISISEEKLAAAGGHTICEDCGATVTLPVPDREINSE